METDPQTRKILDRVRREVRDHVARASRLGRLLAVTQPLNFAAVLGLLLLMTAALLASAGLAGEFLATLSGLVGAILLAAGGLAFFFNLHCDALALCATKDVRGYLWWLLRHLAYGPGGYAADHCEDLAALLRRRRGRILALAAAEVLAAAAVAALVLRHVLGGGARP